MTETIGKKIVKAWFLFMLLLPFQAQCEQESYTQLIQEVFRTELVYPQDKNELQINFVPSYFNLKDQTDIIFPLEFEYGLTDRWQLDVFANTLVIHQATGEQTTSGFGDSGIGTKYSFMNINGSNYHASLSFEMIFPTGNAQKDLGEGLHVYEPSVEFAKDFPEFHHSQLFSQLGFEILSKIKHEPADDVEDEVAGGGGVAEITDPSAHNLFVNIGYFIPVGVARYVIEMNWSNNKWNHHGNENNLYATPGIVWEVQKNVELALGGSIGLTPSSDRYDIFLRGTVEFGG